jgi:hypothetical protein
MMLIDLAPSTSTHGFKHQRLLGNTCIGPMILLEFLYMVLDELSQLFFDNPLPDLKFIIQIFSFCHYCLYTTVSVEHPPKASHYTHHNFNN